MEHDLILYSEFLQNKKSIFYTMNKSVINEWNECFHATNQSSIKSINSVISSFDQSIQKYISDIENIDFENTNLWYQDVLNDNEKHFKEGHNFNIFNLLKEMFGFTIQETMHSRLIKFLLDAKEFHGQGNIFLVELLRILNIESPEEGNWKVTAEIGRIDVLIERSHPQTIIIIENKSNWATDQKNQLYRYWYQAIYQKTKEHSQMFYESNFHKYKILYLVPKKDKELEQQSIMKPNEYQGDFYQELPDKLPMHITIATFDGHINEWLNNCLKVLPENNYRIREYLKQYQSLCDNL